MTRPKATARDDGAIEVLAEGWRMTVAADGVTAAVHHEDAGHHPVTVQLAGALDRTDRTDETLETDPPLLDAAGENPVVTVHRRSSAWTGALTRIACTPQGPEFSWEVSGEGALSQTLGLAVRAAFGGRGGGLRPSGHDWHRLFSPNPGPPRGLTRGAGESAVVGVCGDARPGRGHWFFTPAPLCLALTEDVAPDTTGPAEAPAPHGWWTLSAGAPVGDLTFTEMAYVPSDGGFHLRFAYEGHTRVDGTHRSPAVLLSPGHRDPYAGLRAHRQWLAQRGWAASPRTAAAGRPAWWSEPMFCGWGAQMGRARDTGLPAPQLSSRTEYDAHLAHLESHGLVPGTVVVDDNWQVRYGHWAPDEERWPGLAGWIAGRHARGQRVLLWWKAWSTEGVPDELCVRTAAGRPVALDPGHPGARELLAENIRTMLSPDGLDADGLKIDFTADTPTGEGLVSHGGAWGIALLHQYLDVVHRAAKEAKGDALVVTHTPHPAFADVTDMIRLNDMLRLDDPDPYAPIVPQMRLRAAVAAAACPALPVDTDDWCAPDREQWRAYTAMKDELGVPALYLATHLDRTGEPLEEFDYASLRRLWSRWRARGGTGDRDGNT
ncbi:hypothetical protein [Streptomyces montanisoli]|uniref:Glycoside hydrolase n=1 Tax=Streptomyces montanisoli TaxID=2798581 RepID=A0A940MEG2_9ACTN|nr:hypothetical protein [Streptomyces montanisoli]MBP0457621.1 hypothetical protein [Streptomyces montanisoli]